MKEFVGAVTHTLQEPSVGKLLPYGRGLESLDVGNQVFQDRQDPAPSGRGSWPHDQED